ncbi:MAG: HAD family phosphatase [Bacillota bacterium]|nr:HAD family phosphatase [Bacillota bacterium]
MNNFKAVIFDKDGVIVNTESIHNKVFNNFCTEHGWTITKEEYEELMGMTSTEKFIRLKQRFDFKDNITALVDSFQYRYIDVIASSKELKPIEGVDILIKNLHKQGIKLAVASSATRKKIELVLDRFDLTKYFHATVSGYEVEKSKPAPDIFLKAAEKLVAAPEECIVIEDSANGVAAAKAANMYCIGYQNPLEHQDLSKADIVIKHFSDLLNSNLFGGV